MILNKFPHFKQNNASDCGPTCLRIIAKYYGFNYSSEFLRRLCHISKGRPLQNFLFLS
ncbi:cysteine peptidase family C39 domain-containing protein [Hoylesella timonensis]|uniref:cysteine peptidase family C39 domain-containing protein n=1 Tax=Hoylesella timonensis TaxID=386414 RepID=UPI0035D09071